jgi:flagellar protein FliS
MDLALARPIARANGHELPLPSSAVQAQAIAGYGRAAQARALAASPHELVLLLYRRLAQLVAEAAQAASANDSARRLRATERALAIVEGLDATLDIGRGGSVAAALQQVYALVRARLLAADPWGLKEAEQSITAIADAWAQIAPTAQGAAR